MKIKKCPACTEVLPVSGFGRNKSMNDGLSFYCRACNRARNNQWYRDSRKRQGREVRDVSWVPQGKRWCPTCKQAVPEADYSKNAATSSGLGAECRPCRRSTQNEAYFVRKYGLTRSAVERLRAQQENRCAVCGDEGAAHLDHAHTTGVIRALLCNRCNMGLGLFLDDPARLRAAARYVDEHAQRSTTNVQPPAPGCSTTPRLGSERRDRRGSRPGRRRTDRPAPGSAAEHGSGPQGPAEEAHG